MKEKICFKKKNRSNRPYRIENKKEIYGWWWLILIIIIHEFKSSSKTKLSQFLWPLCFSKNKRQHNSKPNRKNQKSKKSNWLVDISLYTQRKVSLKIFKTKKNLIGSSIGQAIQRRFLQFFWVVWWLIDSVSQSVSQFH